MRGSGYVVPVSSFQLFGSSISFDGEGPTAKCQLKGDDLCFKVRPMGYVLHSVILPLHDRIPTYLVSTMFWNFLHHYIVFARPIGSFIFPWSLKTGLLSYYLGFFRKDKLLVCDLHKGKIPNPSFLCFGFSHPSTN